MTVSVDFLWLAVQVQAPSPLKPEMSSSLTSYALRPWHCWHIDGSQHTQKPTRFYTCFFLISLFLVISLPTTRKSRIAFVCLCLIGTRTPAHTERLKSKANPSFSCLFYRSSLREPCTSPKTVQAPLSVRDRRWALEVKFEAVSICAATTRSYCVVHIVNVGRQQKFEPSIDAIIRICEMIWILI